MSVLKRTIAAIGPLDEKAMARAQARQNDLTKPRGALGRLEKISIQVAGITGRELPRIRHKAVIVMAGDHGVTAEGVSAYPSEVTAQMVLNFLGGGAAINVLARHAGARVVVVDAGVAADIPAQPGLVVRKVGHGTANIRRGPAMTKEQAVRAIEAGIEVLETELAAGLDIVATGDMGIGKHPGGRGRLYLHRGRRHRRGVGPPVGGLYDQRPQVGRGGAPGDAGAPGPRAAGRP